MPYTPASGRWTTPAADDGRGMQKMPISRTEVSRRRVRPPDEILLFRANEPAECRDSGSSYTGEGEFQNQVQAHAFPPVVQGSQDGVYDPHRKNHFGVGVDFYFCTYPAPRAS